MRHRHSHHHHDQDDDRRFSRRRFRGDEFASDPRREHGRGRHGHHGRRSGRMFDHGELRLVVLALIAERPRHGYEIIREIEDRVAGTYSPSPGVIYPTLLMLEELGHAAVTESDGKKSYAITPDGTAYLEANRAAVDEALERMRSVNEANAGGPSPEIVRATQNLKLALSLRLGRGPLTEEQNRAVAAALDTAAISIERA